jgi:hypothetical protein
MKAGEQQKKSSAVQQEGLQIMVTFTRASTYVSVIVLALILVIGVQRKQAATRHNKTNALPFSTTTLSGTASSPSITAGTSITTSSTTDTSMSRHRTARMLKDMETLLSVKVIRVYAHDSVSSGDAEEHTVDVMLFNPTTTAATTERVRCESSDQGRLQLISRSLIYPVTGDVQAASSAIDPTGPTDPTGFNLEHTAPNIVQGFPFENPRSYGFVKAEKAKYDFTNMASLAPMPQEDFYNSIAHKQSALAVQYN